MLKRILAILMALVLCLPMFACKVEKKSREDDDETEETSVEETVGEETESTEDETAAEFEEISIEPVDFSFGESAQDTKPVRISLGTENFGSFIPEDEAASILGKAEVDYCIDASLEQLLLNFTVNVYGMDIDVSAYGKDGDIILSSNYLTNSYAADAEKLIEVLAAQATEENEGMISLLSALDTVAIADAREQSDFFKNLAERYSETIVNLFLEHLSIYKKDIDGAAVYKFEFSNEEMSLAAAKLSEVIAEDETLQLIEIMSDASFKEFADELKLAFEETDFAVVGEFTIPNGEAYITNASATVTADSVDTLLAYSYDPDTGAFDISAEQEEAEVKIDGTVDDSGFYCKAANYTDGELNEYVLINANDVKFECTSYDEEDNVLNFIKANYGNGVYALEVLSDEGEICIIKLDYTDDDFVLTISNSGAEICFYGKYELDDNYFRIEPIRITNNGVVLIDFSQYSVYLEIETDVRFPSVPDDYIYVDVENADALTKLYEDITTEFSDNLISSMLG